MSKEIEKIVFDAMMQVAKNASLTSDEIKDYSLIITNKITSPKRKLEQCLTLANEMLSVDSDGLTLDEMFDAIVEQNDEDPSAMVDYIDGVYMCENLEFTFTCKNFLEHVGYE